ncbi:MAG: hypothetical protein WCA45_01835 [Thiobacillaceae bacterium]
MPTLNWIGKEAVVKHHKDVPFRLLVTRATFDTSTTIIVATRQAFWTNCEATLIT